MMYGPPPIFLGEEAKRYIALIQRIVFPPPVSLAEDVVAVDWLYFDGRYDQQWTDILARSYTMLRLTYSSGEETCIGVQHAKDDWGPIMDPPSGFATTVANKPLKEKK